jgi:lipopolysaccharide transport system ATP-binding protein
MIESILEIKNLGKCFRSYQRERHRFMSWIGLTQQAATEHWALQDINFSLRPGETVGIIGQNGAGKSTLLKLITGTLRPSRGNIRTHGRISAILELGMGFNPEFTGRRNAFHAAGLLGFSRQELQKILPDIQEFSEIGDYFDRPVRTYSSGMQMRLAFSVVTARRPDILIVDEALSVGDGYFQHKCMQRIRSFKEAGTTLLFVSHSPDAIRMLCSRGLLLENGKLIMDADAASVIDFYRASLVKRCEHNTPNEDGSELQEMLPALQGRKNKTVLVRGSAVEVDVKLLTQGPTIRSGDQLTIQVIVSFKQDFEDPHVGMGLRNRLGVIIYEANTYTLGRSTRPVHPGQTLRVNFTFPCNLFPGTYELMLGVADGGYDRDAFERSLFFDQSYLIFEVLMGEETGWSGLWNVQPQVTVQ